MTSSPESCAALALSRPDEPADAEAPLQAARGVLGAPAPDEPVLQRRRDLPRRGLQGRTQAACPGGGLASGASVLTAHKSAGEATQVHDHYLKGTVYCGACGSRLIVSNAKNNQGNVYPLLRVLRSALQAHRLHPAGHPHRGRRVPDRGLLPARADHPRPARSAGRDAAGPSRQRRRPNLGGRRRQGPNPGS
jgi:hypothetical protein